MKNLLTIFVILSMSLILLSNAGSLAFQQQEANLQNNASSLSESQNIDENLTSAEDEKIF